MLYLCLNHKTLRSLSSRAASLTLSYNLLKSVVKLFSKLLFLSLRPLRPVY
uniref:Uncharacterized protein n=1 Tax=Enterococcus phage PMBT56 TaxID=3229530 RepID=A0AB39C6A1_9CAUD